MKTSQKNKHSKTQSTPQQETTQAEALEKHELLDQNRIKDTVERLSAQKRGGGHKIDSISGDSRRSEDGILPPVTTTPSREAGRHERARVLREAIDSLSDEYRDLVRMCLFEEMSVPMAAKLLSLADSTAYRRLLAGASMLRARVQSALGQGSWHEAKGP